MHCPDQVYTACARLTAAFAVLADAHRNEELGALFTEDCSFERPGVNLASRAELVAFMSKRPRDQIVRHCCAAPLIELSGEGEATGITYLTFLHGEAQDSELAKLTGIAAFAEYRDRFVETPEGWRIAARQVVPMMMAG